MNDIKLIQTRFAEVLNGTPGFGGSVLFDCGEAGSFFVDGMGERIVVAEGSASSGAAKCTIAMGAQTLGAIIEGELEESAAFTQGDMKLSGDIRLATLVSNLLRSRAQEMVQAEIEDPS